MSELGQNAKNSHRAFVVRFTPVRDRIADIAALRICAINGLMHCSKQNLYSITSSARADKSDAGVSAGLEPRGPLTLMAPVEPQGQQTL